MTEALRIAIVGYGIAGVAAAITLRALGHRIEHFERSNDHVQPGAGLLLPPAVLPLLDRLGVLDEVRRCAAEVHRIDMASVDGGALLALDYAHAPTALPALGIQRAALHALLMGQDGGRGQLRRALAMVDVDIEEGVLLDTNQRSHGPFDLIVAADGSGSALRHRMQRWLRHDRACATPALVCLLDDPHGLAQPALLQRYAGCAHLSMWPVGSAPGSNTARVGVALRTRRNIEAASPAALREEMLRLFPGRSSLNMSAEPRWLRYRYRDVELRRYSQGRLVLIGDAAHSMSPQLGQGVHLALHDAISLADALARHRDPSRAVAEYDHQQRTRAARVQSLSRWLTPLFQSDSRTLALARDRLLPLAGRVPVLRRQMLRQLDGTL